MNFFEKTGKVLKNGTEQVVKASKIGKLMVGTSILQRKKNKLLTDMGKITLDLVKNGELQHEHLTNLAKEVDILDEKILKEEDTIQKFKTP